MSERPIAPSPPKRSRSLLLTVMLVLLSLCVLAVFGTAVAGFVMLIRSDTPGEAPEGSTLVIDLREPVSDAPGQAGLFEDPGDYPVIATEIAGVLRLAASDPNIARAVVQLGGEPVGWALGREIREALLAFGKAGKPCVAYGDIYTMQDYYLASACETLLVSPAGLSLVWGVSSTITYVQQGLEQHLGIRPQFVHVGEYKTAIEPYTRMTPSQAAIEANEALLDSLYSTATSDIAASRGLSPEQFMAMVDALPLASSDAVKAGLFDATAYPGALFRHLDSLGTPEFLASLQGDPKPITTEEREALTDHLVPVGDYRKRLWSNPEGHASQIAVVYAEGVILSGDGTDGLLGDAGLFDRSFKKWMAAARRDDAVKAVVIRVNSPGGSALASDHMVREVLLTKAVGKPVVVSMGNYAASGGYMLSCYADWIVAQPNTITGSIGIFGQYFGLTGLYSKLGLAEHTFKRGAHADLLNVATELTESERALMQDYVQSGYDRFVGQVAEGRGREVAAIEASAQGRVWTGTQALDPSRGLVDQLGGLHQAIHKAAELAELPKDAYGLRKWPEQQSWFEQLVETFESTHQVDVALLQVAEPLLQELAIMQAISRDGGAAAYLPGVEYR